MRERQFDQAVCNVNATAFVTMGLHNSLWAFRLLRALSACVLFTYKEQDRLNGISDSGYAYDLCAHEIAGIGNLC
jgi:hypothetical protein